MCQLGMIFLAVRHSPYLRKQVDEERTPVRFLFPILHFLVLTLLQPPSVVLMRGRIHNGRAFNSNCDSEGRWIHSGWLGQTTLNG